MEIFDQFGIALGLASLAGINLYLTVGVAGLAIRFHWITLDPAYAGLEVLANPLVLILAWVFFLLEFFADKIPWVDSTWDAIQTFIRPVGGTLLALAALGTLDPAIMWSGALLAGGTTMTTHLGKAGLRLASNLNPEPASNSASSVAASTAEDGIVLGGLALTAVSPWLAFFVFVVLVLLSAWFLKTCFKAGRSMWIRLFKRSKTNP